MKAGMTIIRNIVRPSKELVEAFRDIPAANLDDCMGRTASIGSSIFPIGKKKILGTAFTVRVPQGDNLMVHKVLDMAQPGDILVIDAGGYMNRSIMGSLMATYCNVRGLAGIVINGCIRDRDELSNMDFPVYACGSTPNGPYKNGPGEINVPVTIGDRVIFPGDIIAGDGDGLVVIRPQEAESVLADVKKIMLKEAEIMKGILEKRLYPRPWVDDKLRELGYENIE